MRVNIDVSMEYALEQDDAALLAIAAAHTGGQSVHESVLDVDDATLCRIDGEGGVGERVWAFIEGEQMKLRYRARVDVTRPDVALQNRAAAPVHQLPPDVFTFLRPSRFCPSDLLATFVEKQFGQLAGGAKIAAMAEWIAASLSYVPGSSNATTTAIDTLVSRAGVCRDYAHVMCSLARAANIPARYISGYGPDVTPPDFHALAEVWLDDAWHLVDPTGMSTASGLVIIAAGRDAGDTPFMETGKPANPISQSVDVSYEREG
ncbi:MAG: transglutaminase family protein [Salinarimonas sp.]|nr:transglutaminase family protein [Salinarimonas sp.]